MSAPRIHIGELSIRVPGLSPAAARALGQRVADTIAAGVANGTELRHSTSALRIQVNRPNGAQPERLAGEIANAVLRSLR